MGQYELRQSLYLWYVTRYFEKSSRWTSASWDNLYFFRTSLNIEETVRDGTVRVETIFISLVRFPWLEKIGKVFLENCINFISALLINFMI